MICITDSLFFDPALGLILQWHETRAEVPAHIQLDAKLSGLFNLLLAKPGELVSRETFVQEVWDGNEWVGEKALTRNMSRLRILLKEHGLGQKCQIKTFPKKGYALIIDRKQTQTSIFVSPYAASKPIVWFSLCLLLLGVGLSSMFFFSVEEDVEEYHQLIMQDEGDFIKEQDIVGQQLDF